MTMTMPRRRRRFNWSAAFNGQSFRVANAVDIRVYSGLNGFFDSDSELQKKDEVKDGRPHRG